MNPSCDYRALRKQIFFIMDLDNYMRWFSLVGLHDPTKPLDRGPLVTKKKEKGKESTLCLFPTTDCTRETGQTTPREHWTLYSEGALGESWSDLGEALGLHDRGIHVSGHWMCHHGSAKHQSD